MTADYFDRPEMNISRLLRMEKSPLHFRHGGDKDTKAKGSGRLIHLGIFEPELYESRVVTCDLNHNSNDFKKFRDESEAEGKIVIKSSEHRIIMAIVVAVLSHDEAAEYLSGCSMEIERYWTHRSGRACKSKFDGENVERRRVIDLKSTVDCEILKFGRDAAKFNYHTRAAFYSDAYEATHGHACDFFVIAVEKEPPHAVAPYTFPPDALESGRLKYERLLTELKRCEDSGVWPGPNGGQTKELIMPPWAFSELDVQLDIGGVNVAV